VVAPSTGSAAVSAAIVQRRPELDDLLRRRPVCPDHGAEPDWQAWEHESPWLDDRWGLHDACLAWLDDVAAFTTPHGAGTARGRHLALAEALHHLNYLGETGQLAPEPARLYGRGVQVTVHSRVMSHESGDAYLVVVTRGAGKEDWVAAWDTLDRPRRNGRLLQIERPQRALLLAAWRAAGSSETKASQLWSVRTGDAPDAWGNKPWASKVPELEQAAYDEWLSLDGKREDLEDSTVRRAVRQIRKVLDAG
jgi:hypothetical protein